MLNYKQIWHGIKPIRWLNKFNLTISSQDEKMKSLKQDLVESKAKIETLTSTKPTVDNRNISVFLKPKAEKVYIPPSKRNNKKNSYFARLDQGKSFDVDAKVSKPKSKPTVREHNKFVFVPFMPKDKVYIPPFKKNHKEKAYLLG